MNRTSFAIFGIVAVATASIAGYVLTRPTIDQFAQCKSGAISGGLGALGGEFSLIDESGNRVTQDTVFSKPAILYFGYTYCPDVCPLDTMRNAEAIDILQNQGYDIRQIFVSVDPERDTPEALTDFTDMIQSDMLGLTGTPEEIAHVNKLWRNYYQKQDGEEGYYLVDHMTNSFLILPEYGTVGIFDRGMSEELVAERIGCFLEKR